MTADILITGGAGFLGLACARALSRRFRVRLLDCFIHGEAQRREAAASGLDCVRGDMRERPRLIPALDGVHTVIHLASLAGVDRVRARAVETMETILQGTSILLEACRSKPIRRLVFVSTSEVYGAEAEDAREDCASAGFDPTQARWCYGAAKLAAEHLVLAHGRQHAQAATVVRPFNVYGPGQFGQGAVHAFVRQALGGGPLVVHNQGDPVRAWLFVDDFVRGMERVLDCPRAAGSVFNLGNARACVSVGALARRVAALTDDPPIVYEARPGAEVMRRVPNMDRSRELLGFEAEVGLDEGLRRTLAWYAGQRDAARERRHAHLSG